jgi:hypothetical protein
MGATSVTGVSGAGSVAGMQKGSGNMSIGYNKIIGPHLVACGTQTLSGTSDVLEIPAQVGAVTDYTVIVSGSSSTAAYVSTALAAVTDTDTWTFTITAGSGDKVYWSVLKTGV